MAAGWALAVPLAAACGPAAAPAPTAVPAKPAEAPRPAEAAKPAAPVAPPAAPSPTTAPAAPASIAKVSYGIVTYAPFHIVPIVGIEKPEFMRKRGVEIDLLITGSSPAAIAAIVGGSMHMTTATSESAWAAQDKSPGLFQVAVISTGYPYSLLVNPEIKKIADLRGKPLGQTAVRGGADTTALRLLLNENGLKDGDYNIIQVGALAERTAALKAGTILGTAQIEPQTSALKPQNRDETVAMMAKTMNVDAKYSANAYERHFVKSKTAPLDLRVDAELMALNADLQRKIGAENVPTDFAKYIDNSVVEKAMAG
ncbi:MAG TPA: ABC transporter substrate-binding protein [Reyranella sp.]